ncbi:Elongation factor 1-gamma 2 [Penicillium daleae]|uniref:Elongation factor 1-gamma 2 n=1 Tax=Penicillium daleae TaxID=63821 RepID=A0AAD6G399_9EURO|nr:Elongation factor 1-gamma 2 [Penicillium daleae]KAJ5453833.1 Elongation factor 1-gamma 2 [Penicillium daleae]
MSFGKLYGLPDNGRTIAVLVAAKHNDLDIELVNTQANSAVNTSAEYLKIHPLGKVPAFEGANGFTLSEVIAIAIYVTSQNEKTTLLGKTKQDYASIVRWLSFANGELLPKVGSWYRPLLGFDAYNKKTVDEAAKAALKTIAVLEQHLTANTYLVGERITLADLFTASLLTRAFATVLDKKFRSANPAVTRWYNTIIAQAAFKAVVPSPVFAEEVIKYTPPRRRRSPSPLLPPPPPLRSPLPPPSPSTLSRPLASPPSSSMSGSASTPTRTPVPLPSPWFWQNYKPEEYSLWKVDYKYNEELKLTFMANNLIGGFHARLEASRKYLFGAQAVYGANYACVIKGVFLVRGQEAIPAFDVAPDWESYNFEKLDHTSEADRKYIEDMWAWDVPVTVDGKTLEFADGHVFK